MLKALKGLKKRLGSGTKLHEQQQEPTAGPRPQVKAAPAAAPERAAAATPSGLPPRPQASPAAASALPDPQHHLGFMAPVAAAQQPSSSGNGSAISPVGGEPQAAPAAAVASPEAGAVAGASPAAAAAAAGAGAPSAAAPLSSAAATSSPASPGVPGLPGVAAGYAGESLADAPPAVDYELVAGPLELDGVVPEGHADVALAAEAGIYGGEQHEHGQQQGQLGVWGDDSAEGSSAPCMASPEEDAAAAVLLAEAHGGSGDGGASPTGDGSGGDAGVAAAEAGAAEAGGQEVQQISDALATMMYLTEDAEGGDDCVSVVSDALSEEDLPDDISELSRALEALEGEALGSSPGAPSAASSSVALEDRLAEQLGLSPDADPTGFVQQMAKLYNNLGLKMMERRKHDEALGLLRKAEAVVDNEAVWQQGRGAARRQRMQAITYNNLGCLFKRRNMPQLALQYLQKALVLEENVQNSSSTHLNICAAYSALKRPKEALSHAERAIILLQRHLWPHGLAFQDGLSSLVRQLAAPGASRHLLASANVLAMAYHNAAVEHEKLGRLREALVSFTRAFLISSKCLGAKAQMTTSLSRALKAFQQRQARYLPTGAAHAARKAPSLASSRSAASAAQSKRGARGGSKTAAASKSASNLSSKAVAGSTLPLDKGRTTTGSLPTVRPASSSRLASQLQQPQG